MNTSLGCELIAQFPSAGERRRSRERALGLLYEAELKHEPMAEVLRSLPHPPEHYAEYLVRGVNEHHDEIDRLVSSHAQAWSIERMPPIDRNIVRLATFELLGCEDVPTAVAIDEAVELAKLYSTEDSSRFVNGVLSAIAKELRDDKGDAQ